MKERELLKYALEHGMIDVSYVQEQIEMNKRKEILEKHPYKIWEGKDGKWRTYIPNEKGRKLVKRNTRVAVEDEIIRIAEKPTVSKVFNLWIQQKLKYEEIQKQTYDRYMTDYVRFFEESNFCKRDIRDVEEIDLEEFIRDEIQKHNLTAKAYSGLRTLIIGIFKYAKKHKMTSISISNFMGDIDIPKKCFSKRTFSSEESVFTSEEEKRIKDYIMENCSLINLGILLIFEVGVRAGELSALKKSDIVGNRLRIRRTEIRYKDDDGKYVFEVRESPKTDAGNRDIILSLNAMDTLKRIVAMNPFGEYLFMRNGERIKGKAFTVKLEKICRYIGINERSAHKARKTYATKLVDGGVDKSIITQQMGHTSIDCTMKYYYFNNKTDKEAEKQVFKALNG